MIDGAGVFDAEGACHAATLAREKADCKEKDLTLIWLTVVKEKTVSLPLLNLKGIVSAIAPEHNQRRDPFGDD